MTHREANDQIAAYLKSIEKSRRKGVDTCPQMVTASINAILGLITEPKKREVA